MKTATNGNRRKTISWIHLSDIHATDKRVPLQLELFRSLPKAIEKCVDIARVQPDFLFVTGDLTDQGNEGGFRRAWDLINTISVQQQIPNENVFVVPGNHDIDLNMLPDEIDDVYNASQVPPGLTFEKWKRFIGSVKLTHFESYMCAAPDGPSKNLTQLWYATSRKVHGIAVDVIGINSAWLSWRPGKKSVKYGQLLSGSQEQFVIARAHLRDKNPQPPLTFVLTHYPPAWSLPETEIDILRQAANSNYFLLHGHEHQDWHSAEGESWHKIAGGAVYKGADDGPGTRANANGMGEGSTFNLGRIDIGKSRLDMWFWEYHHNHWIPLNEGSLQGRDGTVTHSLLSLRPSAAEADLNEAFREARNDARKTAESVRDAIAKALEQDKDVVVGCLRKELHGRRITPNATTVKELEDAFGAAIQNVVLSQASKKVDGSERLDQVEYLASEAIRQALRSLNSDSKF